MPSRTSCPDRSLHCLIPCGPQYGSVLNVEMTAEARELTFFKQSLVSVLKWRIST